MVAFFFLLPWEKLEKAQGILNNPPADQKPLPTFQVDNLEAQAAIVIDEKTGQVLFTKNPNEILPLASITKLMTAIVATENLNSDYPIFITENHLSLGSNAGLLAGTTWKFKDLKDYMLTTSSNGAAKAMSDAVNQKTGRDFIFLMNTKAKTLGLNSLHFNNETGLDEMGGRAGGSGSVQDVAKLMTHIIKYEPNLIESTRLSTIRKETIDHATFFGQNTNLIIRTIPGFIGSKTGFTDQAGGNLVIAFDAGLDQPVIIVVLGSTQDGRFSDMTKLVNKTIETLAK